MLFGLGCSPKQRIPSVTGVVSLVCVALKLWQSGAEYHLLSRLGCSPKQRFPSGIRALPGKVIMLEIAALRLAFMMARNSCGTSWWSVLIWTPALLVMSGIFWKTSDGIGWSMLMLVRLRLSLTHIVVAVTITKAKRCWAVWLVRLWVFSLDHYLKTFMVLNTEFAPLRLEYRVNILAG